MVSFLRRSGKTADVSLIEFIPVNKKIEASALYDDELLGNSCLRNLMLVMSY